MAGIASRAHKIDTTADLLQGTHMLHEAELEGPLLAAFQDIIGTVAAVPTNAGGAEKQKRDNYLEPMHVQKRSCLNV